MDQTTNEPVAPVPAPAAPAPAPAPASIGSVPLISVGDLFSETIAAFKENFKIFATLLIAPIVVNLLMLLPALLGGAVDTMMSSILPLFFVFVIVMVYVSILSAISILLVVKNGYQGKGVLDMYKDANRYFWGFLGTHLASGLMTFLWFLLLIIPGLIFAVYYGFAVFVYIFEGTSGFAAVKRSRQLVSGRWWGVVGRALLLMLCFYAFIAVISVPAFYLSKEMMVWWQAITTIVEMLAMPFFMIYYSKIYKSLAGK